MTCDLGYPNKEWASLRLTSELALYQHFSSQHFCCTSYVPWEVYGTGWLENGDVQVSIMLTDSFEDWVMCGWCEEASGTCDMVYEC